MKKIIVFLGTILVILIAVTVLLTNLNKKNKQTSPVKNPPLVPVKLPPRIKNSKIDQQGKKIPPDIQSKLPYKGNKFSLDYSTSLGKLIVSTQSQEGIKEFKNWLKKQDKAIAGLVEKNPHLTIFTDKPISDVRKEVYEEGEKRKKKNGPPAPISEERYRAIQIESLKGILKDVLSFGDMTNLSPTAKLSPATPSPSKLIIPLKEKKLISDKFIYYSQCGPYAGISLSTNCNLCQAGCGQTTSAMILSSFINPSFNPQTVVKIYKKRHYENGCQGSSFWQAQELFKSFNLKTTDLIFYFDRYHPAKAEEVINDIKNYVKNGWTLFTLANFKDNGQGGHYFWIVDVDQDNHIIAYDAYYGRYLIPFNENLYYPFPKYRVAFGVKK